MAKETKLNDEAGIYQRRAKQTEKQKMKDMSPKERLSYINMYYKKPIIIGCIIVVALCSLLYSVFSPKPEDILNVAVVNDYMEEDKQGAFVDSLKDYLQIDSDKQQINFDATYYVSNTTSAELSSSSQQKIMTYVAAKQLDVIIADEDYFKRLCNAGYFCDLAEQLPADMYSYLSDSYFISTTDESTEQNTYGIYLDKSAVYKSTGSVLDKPILGIVANSPNKDYAQSFIKFLFPEQ
ncbi:MAG TPA: hypothetical protein VHQ24_11195 [Lachnospiraceae bacterium]|nr:hypothetical protein [Lachnospiraceae bacterium]